MILRPISSNRSPTRVQLQPFGTSNPQPGSRVRPFPSTPTSTTALSREHFTDGRPMAAGLNRLQDKILASLKALMSRPDADQIVLQGQSFLPEVPTPINHGLGRPFVGFSVQNNTGTYGMFFLVPNTDSRLDAFVIQIQSLTLCTADVVVW